MMISREVWPVATISLWDQSALASAYAIGGQHSYGGSILYPVDAEQAVMRPPGTLSMQGSI